MPRLRYLFPLAALLVATSLEAQASRVFLVRHAEKVDASRDPELSVSGMARAIALADTLRSEGLDAILVSQFRRTRMTAAPTSAALGVPIREVRVEGSAATYAAAMAAELDRLPTGSTALVVGHSNTLAPLIAALGGPVMSDLCDAEYANLFVVARRQATIEFAQRHYGQRDAEDADACRRTMRLESEANSRTDGGSPTMADTIPLTEMVGDWVGHNKLWVMPGDPVRESATAARIELAAGGRYLVIRYTWAEKGEPQDGHLIVRLAPDTSAADMVWVDSWHQSASFMTFAGTAKSPNSITALGSYPAPTGPDWGWRVSVTAESRDRFVMRMWNITPDGQEMQAVEAVYARQ